jgi:hypothetical protein
MKTSFLIIMGLGLCAQAECESLSTLDGTTYDNITAKRAEPDGLYIEYTPPGGGVGMSKVKYSRLSPEQQKQYRFDAAKARDYEVKLAKAMEDWRQENARWEESGKIERLAREAREEQAEQVTTDRIMAMAQLKQAEAELARSDSGGAGNGCSYFGGGYWPGAYDNRDALQGGEHYKPFDQPLKLRVPPFEGANPNHAVYQQPTRR